MHVLVEMTVLEIAFALGIFVNLVLFFITSFRVDVLYKLMWKMNSDVSGQIEELIDIKETPSRHLIKRWREGLASAEKGSAAYHAYRNKLAEHNLL